MARNSALLLSALVCTGCGSMNPYAGPDFEPEVVEKPVPVAVDCGVEPSVLVFRWREFEWSVLPVLMKAPESPGGEATFENRFTLTADGYDKLGDNMADVEAAAAQLRNVVKFYRECLGKSAQALQDRETGETAGG